MPIDFDTDFACMFDEDEFATAVIYTPLGGSPASVNVIIDLSVTRIGFESEISSTHDEAMFMNIDIATPKRGDTIAYGSTTHEFISVIEDDGVISSWLVKDG